MREMSVGSPYFYNVFLLPVPSSCFGFPFPFFRVCVYYHGYVPGDMWLRAIRDGILVDTVSHTDWYDTVVRTTSYLIVFFHRDVFCYSLFRDNVLAVLQRGELR